MPNIVSVSFSKFGEGEEENPRSGEFGLDWDGRAGVNPTRLISRSLGHRKLVGLRSVLVAPVSDGRTQQDSLSVGAPGRPASYAENTGMTHPDPSNPDPDKRRKRDR